MVQDLSAVILFRMTERLLLTSVVILVAIVVLIGFWRTVQRITLKDGGPLGVAGSVALSTPVFALMAIILYAWVSLSHPISYNAPSRGSDGAGAATELSSAGGAEQFTGAASIETQSVAAAEVGTYARQRTRHQLWTLNCLMDRGDVRGSAENDLTEIKLTLMRAVWDDNWGNLPQFESWARNPASGIEPTGDLLEFYTGRHTGC